MRILHVAPINVAGVPYSMMDMQRRSGHDARLVSLHRNPLTFPEDILLDIPLPRHLLARSWRTYKKHNSGSRHGQTPVFGPRNIFEKWYFVYDDWRRQKTVAQAIEEHRLNDFDVIHFDGGLDFFRDARIARRWKHEGKKIVCHYMGSDLRIRGIHPVLDALSDLNLTNESDHLHLHPDIHYIFIPFDVAPYAVRTEENPRLRIIHSPTNRAMKGTHLILPAVERLRKERDIEFVLVENTPHADVLRIKSTCDIAIEQVGNLGGTGYGRNSLETLAMGIPTITEMTPDYLEWLTDHPFVLATQDTLFEKLIELVDNPGLRRQKSKEGRTWVERYHSYESVHRRLQELYREHGIA